MRDEIEEIEQFLERARQSGEIDKLRSAAFVMAYDLERAAELGSLKMALQVGCALVFDKPLLLIQRYGETIPERLRYFTDEIVEFEPGDFQSPTNQAKLTMAMGRMTERVLAKERRNGK